MSEFPCTKNLLVRGEPFDFFLGGGGERFMKKNSCKAFTVQKISCNTKCYEKNACTDCEVKKKILLITRNNRG